MENEKNENGGFVVNVYSPGNQLINSQVNNYYGTVYQGGAKPASEGISDEQVKKLLQACVGKDKLINSKQKWAGAYWCLRYKCYYPADSKDFCKKIESLHLELPDDYRCDYNNIRRICTMSFMNYDPFGKEEVKVSNMDKSVYTWCFPIAQILAEELGKIYLRKS